MAIICTLGLALLSAPALYAGDMQASLPVPYLVLDTRCAADIIEFQALGRPMSRVVFPEQDEDGTWPGADKAVQHMQALFQYPLELGSILPIYTKQEARQGVRFAQNIREYRRQVVKNNDIYLMPDMARIEQTHMAVSYQNPEMVQALCLQPNYMNSLVDVCLSHNNLIEFPAQLGELEQVRYLDISHNTIVDGIPAKLWDKLRYFNISHNQLERLGSPEVRQTIYTRYPGLLVNLAPNPLRFEDTLLDSRAINVYEALWLLDEDIIDGVRTVIIAKERWQDLFDVYEEAEGIAYKEHIIYTSFVTFKNPSAIYDALGVNPRLALGYAIRNKVKQLEEAGLTEVSDAETSELEDVEYGALSQAGPSDLGLIRGTFKRAKIEGALPEGSI